MFLERYLRCSFLEVSKVLALKLGLAKNEEGRSPVSDRVVQLLHIFQYDFERGYLSRVRLYLALTHVMRDSQV